MAADPTTAQAEANAAELLYARQYDRVYGYCLYKLGSREEAEDAAQTAFLYALRGLRRGVVPVAEANWLLTIAKNVCFAGYRARGRRRRLEVLSDPQALAEAPVVQEEGGESRLRLEDALGQIPEQQRRAILLREWRGLSYREIAAELGLSVAAVETLIFRARRSLAEILSDEAPRSRRRLSGVFDLGGLAAAAKSLLGGASAVKVAAGVTAVTAALVAGPSLSPVPDREQPSQRASTAVASAGLPAPPVAAPDRRVARPLAGRTQERRGDQGRPRRDSRPDARSSRQQPASEGTPASDPAPVADAAQSAGGTGENVVEGTTGAVGGVVGSASGTVEGVVDTATGTLDGAVDGTGLVPEVEDVVGDLSEQAGGVVNGLPPLLP